jgi:hypothetical protein
MGFLRRLLGGGDPDAGASAGTAEPVDAATLDAEERARELELARFDQDRVSDLVRRQQMYADRSWTPPAQGGERRSDDEAGETEGRG